MKYNFVGYGSLMSHASLKSTLKNKKFTPVIVKGYKRIFDLATRKNKNADVLNLEKSRKHFFNGVMFRINEEELKKIYLRELEYNVEKTPFYNWKTGKKSGEGLVVIDYFVEIDRKKKLPGKAYFILCREAAYHISKKFGEMWDQTTFISDNEKVADWIKTHREYDTIKR